MDLPDVAEDLDLTLRHVLWMIFAPLAVDADPARMKQVIDALRAETSPREFGELAAALTVVATKDRRHRDLRGAILALLKEEEVMESSVFELGKQRGEQTGKQTGRQMARVEFYEKRLGRSLTDVERATLIERIDALGFARVDDVILGLPSDALAAWLLDPDAT